MAEVTNKKATFSAATIISIDLPFASKRLVMKYSSTFAMMIIIGTIESQIIFELLPHLVNYLNYDMDVLLLRLQKKVS